MLSRCLLVFSGPPMPPLSSNSSSSLSLSPYLCFRLLLSYYPCPVLLESRILQTDEASDLAIISCSGSALFSSFLGYMNVDFTIIDASISLSFESSENWSSSTSSALGFVILSVEGAS